MESSNARRRALWRVGAALADARLDEVDTVVADTLRRIGKALDVAGLGVFRTDLATRSTTQIHVWADDAAPASIRDTEVRAASDEVVAEMFANEGVAVMPLAELAGERIVADGWEDNVGLLALIDLADDVALTLAVITQAPDIDDADADLFRAFASMLRQFFARVRIEGDLQRRLELEDFVTESVTALAAATDETFDRVVGDTLRGLIGHLGVPGAERFRITPDRVVSEHVVGSSLSDAWRDLRPVGDGRFLNDDLTPSFHSVSTLATAFFGADASAEDVADRREVALFPSEVGDATRTCIALVGPTRTWTSVETDAVSTIGATAAQTSARLEAERSAGHRHAVQEEFAAIAAEFLRVREDTVDQVVPEALGRVARQFGATIALVLELDGHEPGRGSVSHQWGRDGLAFLPG
ncbi:MAG: hypothetical protein AAF081_11645 [Actinomycetota bacterium]